MSSSYAPDVTLVILNTQFIAGIDAKFTNVQTGYEKIFKESIIDKMKGESVVVFVFDATDVIKYDFTVNEVICLLLTDEIKYKKFVLSV
jgi:hypothetical protein